ncbi:MAG: hypothetical protein ACKVE4_04215 [Dissulfuribacterales bacterium]
MPGICSGELIGCLGLTEPDAGSDAVGIQATAEIEAAKGLVNRSAILADKSSGGGKGTEVHKLAAAAIS